MRRLGLFLVVVMLASFSLLNVPAASAGSATFSGTLVPGDPTLPLVALISTPNCTGATNPFPVLYATTTFTVDMDGSYTFDEPNANTALYLYAGSFNSADPAANCVAASNSNPLTFTYALTAGAIYTVVVTDDAFTQAGTSYAVTISGPGEVCLGGSCAVPAADLAGCDMVTGIPEGSVVGQFVDFAAVYWEPGQLTQPTLTIDQGKTYLVAGQDESGQYRKILVACAWVWVESDTVGPNPESPWNGTPLPTTVVK